MDREDIVMERERPVYQMSKETTEQFLASLDPKLIEEAIKMHRVNVA